MKSTTTLICDEVVDCIGVARAPTVPELYAVAERIWTDCKGARSAFAWGELPADAADRMTALRAAHLAVGFQSRCQQTLKHTVSQ